MNWCTTYGLLCAILVVKASEFDDEIYVLHKDKPISKTDVLKPQKKTKLTNSRNSFELSFPMLPEWDEFSINGFDGKIKDQEKTILDEKDSFSDLGDSPISKIFKAKKKPKDKFIMTFTEFFIPIMNHKNMDLPSIPRKFNFFEDFFKDFPMKYFDEPPLLKHKTQKRFLDFNPFLSFVRNTSSKITDLFNNTINNVSVERAEARKHGPSIQKLNNIVLLNNKMNESEVIPLCCAGHAECRQNMHCKQGMCKDQPENENVYVSRQKQMANINKLSRIMLFYTVPILLGIGGIVVAIEIIRKHNKAVKQVQFIKHYDPIQNC